MSKFALFFILLFISGLIGAIFFAPVSSVVLYLTVYFMNPEARWWAQGIPSIPYSLITVFVMLFVLIFNYKRMTSLTKWREQKAILWMIILLCIYLLMWPISIAPTHHSYHLYNFAKLVLTVLVAYKIVNSERSLHLVLWAYIFGAAYIGYYAALVGRNAAGRVESIGMADTGGDGNITAAALVPAVIYLLYYVWLGSWKVRILSVMAAMFVVNGIILINSRGAMVGCALGATLFLGFMLFSTQQRKGQRATAISVLFLGLIGFLALTDQSFWARLATLQDVSDGSTSGSHRIDFWLATFDILGDYPLGVGVFGFEALSKFYLPSHYFGKGDIKAVHSAWFQLLSEAGWQGVVVFLSLLRCIYIQLKETKSFLLANAETNNYFHIRALECAFIGYLGAVTFINQIRGVPMWWCILFLLIAINVYYLQHKRGGAWC